MATERVIDFGVHGSFGKDGLDADNESIKSLGKEIVNAFKVNGFCYLKNHGIDENLIKEYMEVSRKFFEQPVEFKSKFPMGLDYRFGWVKLEREHLNEQRSVGDLHEAFNYTPTYDEEWPPVENFEKVSKDFFNAGKELGLRFCDVLSLGLDLPRGFMRDAHQRIGQKGSPSAVRTLYYPPIAPGTEKANDQVRLGEHFDWGTIAFDFQDEVGGLEVRTPQGDFVAANPIPGATLVTPGAFIQRWTADAIKATEHRILLPNDERRKKVRQSIVWFLNADDDCVIECIDGSTKYKAITARDYIQYKGDIAITGW